MTAKHAPGDTGPECGRQPFRFPQDIAVTLADEVTCRACRLILAARGECPACHEKTLSWSPHPKKLTGVVDGRLTMNDVTAVFYLACDYCSETVIPEVDLETVAAFLTGQGWTPAPARAEGGSSAVSEEPSCPA